MRRRTEEPCDWISGPSLPPVVPPSDCLLGCRPQRSSAVRGREDEQAEEANSNVHSACGGCSDDDSSRLLGVGVTLAGAGAAQSIHSPNASLRDRGLALERLRRYDASWQWHVPLLLLHPAILTRLGIRFVANRLDRRRTLPLLLSAFIRVGSAAAATPLSARWVKARRSVTKSASRDVFSRLHSCSMTFDTST